MKKVPGYKDISQFYPPELACFIIIYSLFRADCRTCTTFTRYTTRWNNLLNRWINARKKTKQTYKQTIKQINKQSINKLEMSKMHHSMHQPSNWSKYTQPSKRFKKPAFRLENNFTHFPRFAKMIPSVIIHEYSGRMCQTTRKSIKYIYSFSFDCTLFFLCRYT